MTQVHLLEKALGEPVGIAVNSNSTDLTADPNPTKPPALVAPALDLAVLLDIPDVCVAQRALTHSGMFHWNYGSLCTQKYIVNHWFMCLCDSHSSNNGVDKDGAVTDKTVYRAQIPHR